MADKRDTNKPETIQVDYSPRVLTAFALAHALRDSILVDKHSLKEDDPRRPWLNAAFERMSEALIALASANTGKPATAQDISSLLGVMQSSMNAERVELERARISEKVMAQQAALAAVGNTVH